MKYSMTAYEWELLRRHLHKTAPDFHRAILIRQKIRGATNNQGSEVVIEIEFTEAQGAYLENHRLVLN